MITSFFGKKWVFENFLPGERKNTLDGFAVERKIASSTTPYQRLLITENKRFGRMLFLNGFLQIAEHGEEVYHEMLVHPALLSHAHPQRILIIGGGDGGALREALKHQAKEVFLVEIDKQVIEASKEYFPSVSRFAFKDRRASIIIGDGREFVRMYREYFDCIILDSNDPDGTMASLLFSTPFFSAVAKALKPAGIFALQTGLRCDAFGAKSRKNLRKVFPFVWLHRAYVEYYMSSEHTFSVASKKDYRTISQKKLEQRYRKRNLATAYYSPAMHLASAVLPSSWEKEM